MAEDRIITTAIQGEEGMEGLLGFEASVFDSLQHKFVSSLVTFTL